MAMDGPRPRSMRTSRVDRTMRGATAHTRDPAEARSAERRAGGERGNAPLLQCVTLKADGHGWPETAVDADVAGRSDDAGGGDPYEVNCGGVDHLRPG